MTTSQIPAPPPHGASAALPPALAPRVPNWLADGIDPAALHAALDRLPPGQGPASPAWVRHFSAVGDGYAHEGDRAAADGHGATARQAYLSAAFFYFLARFPHILGPDPALARAAYAKHRAAYLQASRYFDPPLQVVRLPFAGAEIVGDLRIPATPTGTRPPAVILSGGIDYWKSESELHTIAETLLAAGLATCALDMPGTGECPVPNGPDAERVYRAAITHLAARPDLEGARLGVYGLSFGGHWAVKLALTRTTSVPAASWTRIGSDGSDGRGRESPRGAGRRLRSQGREQMSTDSNNALVRRLVNEGQNRGTIAAWCGTLAQIAKCRCRGSYLLLQDVAPPCCYPLGHRAVTHPHSNICNLKRPSATRNVDHGGPASALRSNRP